MNLKKLTLLSLLTAALFVPQQSHATFNWGKWTAIGVGLLTASYLGYQFGKSIIASNEGNDKNIIKEKIKLNEKLIREKEEIIKELKKQKEIELKTQKKHEIFIEDIGTQAMFAGSEYETINKQYDLKSEDQINFEDLLCACYDGNKKTFYIPLKTLINGCSMWDNYFLTTKKETPYKIIKIGSYIINFEKCKLTPSKLKDHFNALSLFKKTCLCFQDKTELDKRGVSFDSSYVDYKKMYENQQLLIQKLQNDLHLKEINKN